jgi:hypothetical protein
LLWNNGREIERVEVALFNWRTRILFIHHQEIESLMVQLHQSLRPLLFVEPPRLESPARNDRSLRPLLFVEPPRLESLGTTEVSGSCPGRLGKYKIGVSNVNQKPSDTHTESKVDELITQKFEATFPKTRHSAKIFIGTPL